MSAITPVAAAIIARLTSGFDALSVLTRVACAMVVVVSRCDAPGGGCRAPERGASAAGSGPDAVARPDAVAIPNVSVPGEPRSSRRFRSMSKTTARSSTRADVPALDPFVVDVGSVRGIPSGDGDDDGTVNGDVAGGGEDEVGGEVPVGVVAGGLVNGGEVAGGDVAGGRGRGRTGRRR